MNKSPTSIITASKAFIKNSDWPDKDELLDVVYWTKQVLAMFIGILWGLLSMKGIFSIVIYCAISTVVLNFYVTNFQNQDIEEYGGFWELAKEGFMSSFASFMVLWIIFYTIHFT